MKKCLCCGWEGQPPEWSCPCCGEASWTEKDPQPAPEPEAPAKKKSK